ncbi:MAG TPA: hypothetical protein VN088_17190 [Nocardioides sp.]|nr:hypothetical protein [Nocardioides sp.]
MTGKDDAALAAGRAAGYCWADNPRGRGTCTRPPGHDGDHVDHYNGRPGPGATEGYRWPQIKDSRRA